MRFSRIICLFLVVVMHSSGYGQSRYYNEKLFEQDAKEMAQLLDNYVSCMTDNSNGEEVRNYYRKKNLVIIYWQRTYI